MIENPDKNEYICRFFRPVLNMTLRLTYWWPIVKSFTENLYLDELLTSRDGNQILIEL